MARSEAPPLQEVPDWVWGLFPDAPAEFLRTPHPLIGPFVYNDLVTRSLAVICSAQVEADGKRWIHVSCSRADRLPSWKDLRRVKDVFVGVHRKAVQVFPAQSEYVNVHPNVLHLWACLDGDPLPDFRLADGTI